VFERLHWARRGVRGGVLGPPSGGAGGQSPPSGGSGAYFPENISRTTYFRDHMILGGFRHMVFCRWFSISG
jgi:hypothetical protein